MARRVEADGCLYGNLGKCLWLISQAMRSLVRNDYRNASAPSQTVDGRVLQVRIPVTATITFLICWGFVATGYKLAPKYAKWIFG